MTERIETGKVVALKYSVFDAATGQKLSGVEKPLAYLHGHDEILMPQIVDALQGKKAGEVIEFTFNGDELFGPRDESLVFIDREENVPEEYRKVGMQIMMENANGDVRTFYVTRIEDGKVVIDGNSPFSGRTLQFRLEIVSVRDATEEELEAGMPEEVRKERERMEKLTGGAMPL